MRPRAGLILTCVLGIAIGATSAGLIDAQPKEGLNKS